MKKMSLGVKFDNKLFKNAESIEVEYQYCCIFLKNIPKNCQKPIFSHFGILPILVYFRTLLQPARAW